MDEKTKEALLGLVRGWRSHERWGDVQDDYSAGLYAGRDEGRDGAADDLENLVGQLSAAPVEDDI